MNQSEGPEVFLNLGFRHLLGCFCQTPRQFSVSARYFGELTWLSFSGPPLQRWRGAPVQRCEEASDHLAWTGGAL